MTVRIITGDALAMLREMPDQSVNCCVTSPPYFGLRDYGIDRQIGNEETPAQFIERLVAVFREVKRVLRNDGTLWLNIGDSFAHDQKWGGSSGGKHVKELHGKGGPGREKKHTGLKPKDLIGIPWMLAFALRDDGWYLRSDIVWAKPNSMPESVTDRPTRSHEMVFLLSKSPRYYYDNAALRTPPQPSSLTRLAQDIDSQAGSTRANGGAKRNGAMKAVGCASDKQHGHSRRHAGFNERWDEMPREEQLSGGANLKSVWWLSPAQFKGAHFAVMPATLAEICVIGGCPKGGTVLDPFGGAGTTGLVADRLQRDAILIELNPDFAAIAADRLRGGLAMVEGVEARAQSEPFGLFGDAA